VPDLSWGDATWRKSSYSTANSECVEVARTADAVGVRDSKNATGPMLTLAPNGWSALIDTLR
jgi:hypothetical protein